MKPRRNSPSASRSNVVARDMGGVMAPVNGSGAEPACTQRVSNRIRMVDVGGGMWDGGCGMVDVGRWMWDGGCGMWERLRSAAGIPHQPRTVGNSPGGARDQVDHFRHVREIDAIPIVVDGVIVLVHAVRRQRVRDNPEARKDDVV